MANVDIPASGNNYIATNTLTRDAATEHIQCINPVDLNCIPLFPTNASAVAAGATAAALKTGAGRLFGITITAVLATSAAITITDGLSGTIIAAIPAGAPIGDYSFTFQGRPFSTSLYVNSGANTPAITVFYA